MSAGRTAELIAVIEGNWAVGRDERLASLSKDCEEFE